MWLLDEKEELGWKFAGLGSLLGKVGSCQER